MHGMLTSVFFSARNPSASNLFVPCFFQNESLHCLSSPWLIEAPYYLGIVGCKDYHPLSSAVKHFGYHGWLMCFLPLKAHTQYPSSPMGGSLSVPGLPSSAPFYEENRHAHLCFEIWTSSLRRLSFSFSIYLFLILCHEPKSEPSFPHLKNGNNNISLQVVIRIKRVNLCKLFRELSMKVLNKC